jgi:3-phenylpropionate/trans-cinnamate dioxygenase ferredoxin reductase subunit
LAAKPRRVLIIGSGFIGSEVASVCRGLGLEVTVAERGPAPLSGPLGGVIGVIAAEMQREAGVDLRTGVSVLAMEGDAGGHVRRASLSDGTKLDVDVVVTSLGSIRNIEWLNGAGLAAGFWGVGCDAGCRAFDVNGLVTTTSSSPATSRGPRTCFTTTSSWPWSTGTTPCWGRRSRRTTWFATRRTAGRI